MEASGGYERLAYLLLSELGQPCAAPLNARNGISPPRMGLEPDPPHYERPIRLSRTAPSRPVPPSPATAAVKALVERAGPSPQTAAASRVPKRMDM